MKINIIETNVSERSISNEGEYEDVGEYNDD